MSYQCFYHIVNVALQDAKKNAPYEDVWFIPVYETYALMAQLKLQAVEAPGGFSVFLKEEYRQLPRVRQDHQTALDNAVLYFAFHTRNPYLGKQLQQNAPLPTGDLPMRWKYRLDNNTVGTQLVYPPVFTHTVHVSRDILPNPPATKDFLIRFNGLELPENALYNKKVLKDDNDNYACTANLAGCPAGIYELLLEGEDPFPVYIDTRQELRGKTGILKLPLGQYTYTNATNSSPPAAITEKILYTL